MTSDFFDIETPSSPDFQKMHAIRIMTKDEIARRFNDGERDFSGVVSPNSDFLGMNLAGIILRRAKLGHSSFKNCDISGADFSFAELQDTDFENADISNANFSDALIFNSKFLGAKISGAIFRNANISECTFERCDIRTADFGGAIKESAFKGKIMAVQEIVNEYKRGKRDFSGIVAPNSDFSGENLSGIMLRGANLHYSSFNHTDLTNSDLSGADLTDCAFDNTILRNANLSKSNLYWSRIKNATMENANLKEANISWCNLSETDFSTCDISKANVQWSLTIGTKFSDRQFFSFSPDVLATLKISAPDTDIPAKTRTASGASHSPYAASKGVGEYAAKSENILVYGERGFEVSSAYSPKGKKEIGKYKNLE